MELGYVATRPRFTRVRRTWSINHRNLVAEDVRAFRTFRDTQTLRGALPFYYPNLVDNGGFESPATPGSLEIVRGWSTGAAQGSAIAVQTFGYRGTGSTSLYPGISGSTAIGFTAPGAGSVALSCDKQFSCMAGDTLTVTASMNYTAGLPINMTVTAQVTLAYDTGEKATAQAYVPLTAAGWNAVTAQIPIPIPSSLTNFSSATATFALVVTAGPAVSGNPILLIDTVGVAKSALALDAIQMAGSTPIAALVRFGSGGLPQFADLGWIGGQKRYGATFKLEEV